VPCCRFCVLCLKTKAEKFSESRFRFRVVRYL
jgi:hypothetical protein